MSESEVRPLQCTVCGEAKGLKRCGYCKKGYYCSQEHQITDWPRHKIFCQSKQNESLCSGNREIVNPQNVSLHTNRVDSQRYDSWKKWHGDKQVQVGIAFDACDAKLETNGIDTCNQKHDIGKTVNVQVGIPSDACDAKTETNGIDTCNQKHDIGKTVNDDKHVQVGITSDVCDANKETNENTTCTRNRGETVNDDKRVQVGIATDVCDANKETNENATFTCNEIHDSGKTVNDDKHVQVGIATDVCDANKETNENATFTCNEIHDSGKTVNGDKHVQNGETSDASGAKKEPGKGIPFDTRPYSAVNTISVKSNTSNKFVAKLVVDNLNANGFCVLDGLFTEKAIDRAVQDIKRCEDKGLFDLGKLAGGRTSGDEDKKVVNAAIRCDTILWVQGSENNIPGVRNVMTKLDRILVEFNELLAGRYFISNRTKAMLARYPGNGAYYKRHVDNPNKDGRVITCILYLNKNWDPEENGGILRILPSESTCYVDVAPTANRLLFFWSDKRNPHEVHPAHRTRYAITVWYMDKTERERARLDFFQEEIANIRGNQQLLCLEECVKRKEECVKRKDELSKELEEIKAKTIDSLTVEELAAIGAVVDCAPNPKELLANLGIHADLHDILLKRLEEMKIAAENT